MIYSNNQLLNGYCFVDGLSDQFEIQLEFEHDKLKFCWRYILINKNDFDYFVDGDILLFRPNGTIRIVYCNNSNDNVLFLTEQCNNHCLMCSQPPQMKNDINYYYWLNTRLIELIPDNLSRIGITGGEPTLLKNGLIDILNNIKNKFKNIDIQLLSNGRNFEDINYVHSIYNIELEKLLIGIPLHSDFYKDHDYIAQSEDAYNQTLKGLYNLAKYDFNIELRIVINKINKDRLNNISNFIFRNLPFVKHVSFMGMEYIGFVPKNKEKIWIDPVEYKEELKKSVLNLSSLGMNVSIFNLPLCLLDKSLYSYSKKSISDWKIKYFDICDECILRHDCGGDFETSLQYSCNIKPVCI